MIIYVSGPMTGLPDNNFPAFNEVAAELTSLGHEVMNPAEKGEIDGWSWEDYLRFDLKCVCDCDTVVVLPGWENSKGARLEVYVANALAIQIFTIEDFRELQMNRLYIGEKDFDLPASWVVDQLGLDKQESVA